MLEYYNTAEQALTANTAIEFPNKVARTNCVVAVTNGTTFTISKPGYYRIKYDGIVEASAAGEIEVQLYINGTAVPYVYTAMTAAAASDVVPLSLETILRVPCSCAAVDNTKNITIVNTGLAATSTNAKIIIERVCA